MNTHSIALVLLATAILLASRAGVASTRLAWLSDRANTRLWRRVTGRRPSGDGPPRRLLAATTGALTSVAVGWPAGPVAGLVGLSLCVAAVRGPRGGREYENEG